MTAAKVAACLCRADEADDVEDRVARLVAALAHLPGQLFDGARLGLRKLGNVREQGFAVGVFVDAF